MQISHLNTVVLIALTLNVIGISLPVTPSMRSLLSPAAGQPASSELRIDRWRPETSLPPAAMQTVSDWLVEAGKLLDQGIQQINTSQYLEAFQSWQRALTICREEQVRVEQPSISKSGEASALMNLGYLYNMLNNAQQAVEHLQQALPMFQALGDRNGEANTLLNLGGSYKLLEKYQNLIDYSEKALTIYQEVGDRSGEAKALGNLGIAYVELGRYQRGVEYYQQSLTVYQEVGDRRGEAIVLLNLASRWEAPRSIRIG